jgi:outer membrane protein
MKVAGSALMAALLLSLAPVVSPAQELPSIDLSQPISADEAVRLALDRNYSIRLAEDRLDQAKASRLGAYGGLVPNASLGWQYQHDKFQSGQIPENFFAPDIPTEGDSRGYNISINHTLISFPTLFNIAARRKSTAAAESDVKDIEQDIAFGVRQQYYRLIESIKILDVRREDLRLATEEQRRTESLFEVGSVARTDVLKARVRVAEAQSALIAAENLRELDEARLRQILVLPGDADLNVIESLDARTDLPDSSGAYIAARENRPDIKAARLRVDAAGRDRRAAVAGKLPFLSHSFNRNFSREQGSRISFIEDSTSVFGLERILVPSRSRSAGWTYRVGVTWNILDGLVTESNVARSAALQRSAENEADDLATRADLEVQEALLAIRAARAQILSAREGLASAEEDLKLSQERYTVGLGTILELIDSQVALTRARSAEVQAMAALKIAEAQLDQATGRETW